ncbi:MAG: site-2 protease family protein [Firmicutes bacterium]|nr:site-2 protease family protein [Bacillota bacterium]
MSSAGFLLSAALVVLIHELGHAAAQRLCGISVTRIVWGRGPLLFRLGVLEVRLVPFSGYVTPVGVLHARRRWQGALIAAAGTLATWAVAVALIITHAVSVGWLREFVWGWGFWSVVGLVQLLPIRQWDGWWALVALGVLPRPVKGRKGV